MDYNNYLNPTLVSIKPSGIRKFFSIAEEMDDVISLGVGEPDFKTPWHIRQTGINSLEQGATRYTANAGLILLRNEIANYYKRRFNVNYSADGEIMVTVGGSEGIDMAIRSLVCPGDEVLVVEPSFVCYKPIIEICGGVAVPIVTENKNNFKLMPEEIENAVTDKTKLIVLPFPNNPTGAVMRRADLEKIAEVIKKHDLFVLSDEIYCELTYGNEKHTTIASIDGMQERTIVINGFSKTYSMTGWRLGYALGPAPVIKQMTKLHQYAIMSAPTTSQYAAVEALRNGEKEMLRMRESYCERRNLMVDGLNRIGLDCLLPKGAFYTFPSVKSTGLSSTEFAEQLLKAEKVAVVPGVAFGACGEGFVRCCYATSASDLIEAIDRMGRFVQSLKH